VFFFLFYNWLLTFFVTYDQQVTLKIKSCVCKIQKNCLKSTKPPVEFGFFFQTKHAYLVTHPSKSTHTILENNFWTLKLVTINKGEEATYRNKETTLLLRDHRLETRDKEWGGGCGIEESKYESNCEIKGN